jgi:hypothetical protein
VTLQNDLTAGSSLPCSLSGTSGTGGTTQTFNVALTYYGTVNVAASPPTASGPITCTGGSVASSSGVAGVGLVITGSAGATAQNATQTIDALYTVTSTAFASGFGIYSNQGLGLDNSVDANTNAGTLFVNGPVNCNSGTVHGSLYVYDPGNAGATSVGNPAGIGLDMTNSCVIGGTLDVNGDVGVYNSGPKVSGNAFVNGSVTLDATGPEFKGNVTASGTVAPSTSQYISGTVTQNTAVTLPAVPTFPIVTWNASDWTSTGWTVDAYTGTCGTFQNASPADPTGVYQELINDINNAVPTVLYTSCAIDLPQDLTEKLSANLAIVDTNTGGQYNTAMDFSQDTFESATSAVHDMYLIVPADPASPTTASLMSQATCGTNYEIEGQNQETFGTATNPIDTLIYDPCTVLLSNDGVITGQLVAGSFGSSLSNELDFTYTSVGSVPGTANEAGGVSPVEEYVQSSK